MPMFQNTVLMVAIVIFIFIMLLIAVVMKECYQYSNISSASRRLSRFLAKIIRW